MGYTLSGSLGGRFSRSPRRASGVGSRVCVASTLSRLASVPRSSFLASRAPSTRPVVERLPSLQGWPTSNRNGCDQIGISGRLHSGIGGRLPPEIRTQPRDITSNPGRGWTPEVIVGRRRTPGIRNACEEREALAWRKGFDAVACPVPHHIWMNNRINPVGRWTSSCVGDTNFVRRSAADGTKR
jgi:hypothetical protein